MAVFKGVVVSKTMVQDPTGTKYIKIDVVEEKELPSAMFFSESSEVSSIARDVIPLLNQILRSLPFTGGKVQVPRVTIWFTEEEIEEMGNIDVGDVVEIYIERSKVLFIKGS